MPGLFVTATGTEVGKTFVTCGLIRAARRAGHLVNALKPILTGYAAPLSPDMAAAAEYRPAPDLAAVTQACRTALSSSHLTLVEGIGGIMVPLDRRHTVLDLVAALDLPVLLVAPTALGAISHTLTALCALSSRGLAPRCLLLVESAGSSVPLAATRETLAAFCPDVSIATLPRDPSEAAFDALLATLGPFRAPRSTA